MRRLTSSCFALLTVLALLGVHPGHANAAIWSEIGDAGDLPGTAQITVGVGSLSAIRGTLVGVDDIDMFAILIPDPSSFGATTVSPNTQFLDTQLFLFDNSGRGILTNDDDPFDPFEFNATIPAGSVTGPAGIYFVAVAEFMDTPVGLGGRIFPETSFLGPFPDEVLGPDGPGGSDPISDWGGDGFTEPGVEAYEIILTGAEPAVIPEPSSLAVWGVGLFIGAILFAGRRRKITASQ